MRFDSGKGERYHAMRDGLNKLFVYTDANDSDKFLMRKARIIREADIICGAHIICYLPGSFSGAG